MLTRLSRVVASEMWTVWFVHFAGRIGVKLADITVANLIANVSYAKVLGRAAANTLSGFGIVSL